MFLAGAAEYDRRRPNFADQDFLFVVGLFVVGVVFHGPKVKVFLGAAAMVFVRVRCEESINERPSLTVALDAVAQVLSYVAGIIVGIVGGGPNVAIDEDGCSGFVS